MNLRDGAPFGLAKTKICWLRGGTGLQRGKRLRGGRGSGEERGSKEAPERKEAPGWNGAPGRKRLQRGKRLRGERDDGRRIGPAAGERLSIHYLGLQLQYTFLDNIIDGLYQSGNFLKRFFLLRVRLYGADLLADGFDAHGVDGGF